MKLVRRPFSIVNKRTGFALIEVTVAAVILGIIAIGLMSIMRIVMNSSAYSNALSEKQLFINNFSTLVANEEICKEMFGGIDAVEMRDKVVAKGDTSLSIVTTHLSEFKHPDVVPINPDQPNGQTKINYVEGKVAKDSFSTHIQVSDFSIDSISLDPAKKSGSMKLKVGLKSRSTPMGPSAWNKNYFDINFGLGPDGKTIISCVAKMALDIDSETAKKICQDSFGGIYNDSKCTLPPPTTCKSDQFLSWSGGQYVCNTLPPKDCAVANGTGSQTWDASSMTWGACKPQTCNAGFTSANGVCMASTQACNVANGSGRQTLDAATGQYGPCVVTSCNSGFSISGGSCVATCTYRFPNITCFTDNFVQGIFGTLSPACNGQTTSAGAVCYYYSCTTYDAGSSRATSNVRSWGFTLHDFPGDRYSGYPSTSCYVTGSGVRWYEDGMGCKRLSYTATCQ